MGCRIVSVVIGQSLCTWFDFVVIVIAVLIVVVVVSLFPILFKYLLFSCWVCSICCCCCCCCYRTSVFAVVNDYLNMLKDNTHSKHNLNASRIHSINYRIHFNWFVHTAVFLYLRSFHIWNMIAPYFPDHISKL